jgi:hypothetical protein
MSFVVIIVLSGWSFIQSAVLLSFYGLLTAFHLPCSGLPAVFGLSSAWALRRALGDEPGQPAQVVRGATEDEEPVLLMPFDGHNSPIAAMGCPEWSVPCTLIQIGTLWLSHYFLLCKNSYSLS